MPPYSPEDGLLLQKAAKVIMPPENWAAEERIELERAMEQVARGYKSMRYLGETCLRIYADRMRAVIREGRI